MNIKENLEENLTYKAETTESINNYLSLSDETIEGERELLSKLKQLYYDRRAEANTQIIKLRAEVDNINKKLEEL
jgi:uncharacterized coiled-coil DUF342 family protein